jgi:hypothetical protein
MRGIINDCVAFFVRGGRAMPQDLLLFAECRGV